MAIYAGGFPSNDPVIEGDKIFIDVVPDFESYSPGETVRVYVTNGSFDAQTDFVETPSGFDTDIEPGRSIPYWETTPIQADGFARLTLTTRENLDPDGDGTESFAFRYDRGKNGDYTSPDEVSVVFVTPSLNPEEPQEVPTFGSVEYVQESGLIVIDGTNIASTAGGEIESAPRKLEELEALDYTGANDVLGDFITIRDTVTDKTVTLTGVNLETVADGGSYGFTDDSVVFVAGRVTDPTLKATLDAALVVSDDPGRYEVTASDGWNPGYTGGQDTTDNSENRLFFLPAPVVETPAPPSGGGGGGGGSAPAPAPAPVVNPPLELGTLEADRLIFDDTDNLFNGLAGDDIIGGMGGNDQILGGGGSDAINGNWGDDLVHGNKGSDEVRGGKGNDIVRGGMGHDFLFGGQGDDQLYGGKGYDQLTGGEGADVFHLSPLDDVVTDFQVGIDSINTELVGSVDWKLTEEGLLGTYDTGSTLFAGVDTMIF